MGLVRLVVVFLLSGLVFTAAEAGKKASKKKHIQTITQYRAGLAKLASSSGSPEVKQALTQVEQQSKSFHGWNPNTSVDTKVCQSFTQVRCLRCLRLHLWKSNISSAGQLMNLEFVVNSCKYKDVAHGISKAALERAASETLLFALEKSQPDNFLLWQVGDQAKELWDFERQSVVKIYKRWLARIEKTVKRKRKIKQEYAFEGEDTWKVPHAHDLTGRLTMLGDDLWQVEQTPKPQKKPKLAQVKAPPQIKPALVKMRPMKVNEPEPAVDPSALTSVSQVTAPAETKEAKANTAADQTAAASNPFLEPEVKINPAAASTKQFAEQAAMDRQLVEPVRAAVKGNFTRLCSGKYMNCQDCLAQHLRKVKIRSMAGLQAYEGVIASCQARDSRRLVDAVELRLRRVENELLLLSKVSLAEFRLQDFVMRTGQEQKNWQQIARKDTQDLNRYKIARENFLALELQWVGEQLMRRVRRPASVEYERRRSRYHDARQLLRDCTQKLWQYPSS